MSAASSRPKLVNDADCCATGMYVSALFMHAGGACVPYPIMERLQSDVKTLLEMV